MSKVLIVDDDKDISDLISLVLKKEGIDSTIVNDSTKVPEIITREDYKHFCLEDFIIEFNFDVEKILKIIEEEFGEDVDIAPFTNGLIYPEHKDDLIDNLTEHLITLSFDNIEKVNKLNSLTAMHTKKKKGKK